MRRTSRGPESSQDGVVVVIAGPGLSRCRPDGQSPRDCRRGNHLARAASAGRAKAADSTNVGDGSRTGGEELERRRKTKGEAARRTDGVAGEQAAEVNDVEDVVEVLAIGLDAHAHSI